MIIKLFDTNEKKFNNNGLGNIQPLKCIETKKKSLNGWYVEVELPIKYFGMIKQDMIILVKTKEKGAQPFRIGNITKQNRKISFTANHVAFDSERYFLLDVRPTNLSIDGYLKWINERTDKKTPFSFSSNVADSGTNYFVRKTLLEALKTVDENYNGVFDFDNFNIKFLQKVGNDNGFSIIYGKNLQSIKAVEDWSGVVTRLYPEGPDGLMLPEKYIESDIQYNQPYTRTEKFDFDTSVEDDEGNSTDLSLEEKISTLRNLANDYIEENKVPKINYTISSDVNQSLCIGDIVHLKHPFVNIKTEVQEYQYNVLSQRVETLTFGNYERDVKKAFNSIKEAITENKQNNSKLLELIDKQTDLINRLNKEGYVYIDENEILILDALPKENAKQVWRFGLGGLGFSNNGYKGPFIYAFTQDGKFNADFIQANSITVNHLASDVGSALDISSNKSIKLIVDHYQSSLYKYEVGSGNLFNNCQQFLTKDYENKNKVEISDMPLGIDKSFLKGNEICISVSIDIINGIVGELNNRIGVEFDVGYADGTKKTYSVYWYLGQYNLQYLIQTSTVDHEERIWATYKLENKEIASVSNLKLVINLNAEKASVSNPKVEFGTKPTGADFDLDYVHDELIVIENKYTTIEQNLESVRIATVDNLNKITQINSNLNTVTSDIDSLEVDTSNLHQALSTVNAEVSSINGTITSMQTTISETVTKQSELISTVDSLDLKTSKHEEKITSITTTVNSNKTAIDNTNTNLSNLSKSTDSSISTINTTIKEIKTDYTEIKSTVDTLTLKASSQEEKITSIDGSITDINGNVSSIEGNISTITSRLDSAEISLKPTNIIMAVNSQIGDGSSIYGTSFSIDKDGVHITGGGLDITGGFMGTQKLFYVDTNGYLNAVNLKATNAQITGTITGSTISGSTITGGKITGSDIRFLSSDGSTEYIVINDYGIKIDGANAPYTFTTNKGGYFELSTADGFLYNMCSPISYRPSKGSSDVWYAAFANGCNRFRWVSNLTGTSYLELQTFFGAYGLNAFKSDSIYKTNICNSELKAIEVIKSIKHRQFNWIESGYHNKCGYIAQELMQIDESFVLGIEQNDGTTRYQVDETTLLPVMSKALQELIEKVEILERRLNENGISY